MKPLTVASISLIALATSIRAADSPSPAVNLLTGEGVSIGNILFPAVNFQTAFGTSTTDPGELLSGHHDPDRKGFTVQNLELSLAAKLGTRVLLFGTYALKVDLDDQWQGEFEEYYATAADLPLDATIRGGRILAKFGMHNQYHPHEFTMVDQNIASGRLLGEDGLALEGGEISLPVFRSLPSGWEDRLTLTFGKVVVPGEEEHGAGEEEAEFEGEGGLFSDWTAVAHYGLTLAPTSQTLHTAGLSVAWGDNRFGRSSQLYGANYEYFWRADGALNRTGHRETSKFLQWRTEFFLRNAGAVASEHEHEHESHQPERKNFTDFAAYSMLTYGLSGGKWRAHLRGEYASGNTDAQVPERWRVSPAVTWTPSDSLPINWKLQYNFDHSASFGDEHSVWLQFNLRWGTGCDHSH